MKKYCLSMVFALLPTLVLAADLPSSNGKVTYQCSYTQPVKHENYQWPSRPKNSMSYKSSSIVNYAGGKVTVSSGKYACDYAMADALGTAAGPVPAFSKFHYTIWEASPDGMRVKTQFGGEICSAPVAYTNHSRLADPYPTSFNYMGYIVCEKPADLRE